MNYNLAFLGFGNVGQALAALLQTKRKELHADFDVTFSVTGIATARHGTAIDPHGIDLASALELARNGRSLEPLSANSRTGGFDDFIRHTGAQVLFENTPVNYQDGQPAIHHIKTALELGMHVVTANKGAVVFGYRELSELAYLQGKHFFFESTVMDGTPLFSLFRSALPAARCRSFKAILNSTTNLVLTRMEAGDTFDAAVRYAQEIGIAETDPAGDIDGHDAAIKVASLITVLLNTPITPKEVIYSGIRDITPEMIRAAAAQGQRYKLICTALSNGHIVTARVAPELVAGTSAFYGISGTSCMIEFTTDALGVLTLVETNPTPQTTAYGLLADFINAVRAETANLRSK